MSGLALASLGTGKVVGIAAINRSRFNQRLGRLGSVAGTLPSVWNCRACVGMIGVMKVLSGTVVGGKVEVPEGTLADGDRVAIVSTEPGEPIDLTPEQELELVAAVEDIRRGKYVDGQELIAELRKHAGA